MRKHSKLIRWDDENMEISHEMKQELLNELSLIFPKRLLHQVDNFQRLPGADTETFSFDLIMETETISLILRLYRRISDRAEHEFNTLYSLFNAGLSVPNPLLWRKESKTVFRSYLIMEKIPGILLSDYVLEHVSEDEKIKLISLFIQKMVDIHKVDWEKHLLNIKKFSLEGDPYSYVDRVMAFPKEMVKTYNMVELQPLIDWLEDNKVKSEKLSLIHGDFHMNNVILTPDHELVVIDWADIKLGDFRHDLGFAIVATSSGGEDVTTSFTDIYERLSGTKVHHIEYYMILSILFNVLRCYSALTNPEITQETEITKNMFLITYRNYTNYLVNLIQTITGISLPTLEKALAND